MLGNILKKITKMNVFAIENEMHIQPNCIYLKPSGKNIIIANKTLYLVPPDEVHKIRHPIDCFLQSLAEDQADSSICIILSGTGTDGAIGLASIKNAGGLTIVQEENSSAFHEMPANAIATGCADHILPVENMPETLIEYVKRYHHVFYGKSNIVIQKNSKDFQKILALLRSKTGHNFTYYKFTSVCRRIEKRMHACNRGKLSDYVLHLQQHPQEIEILFNDLLIGVTGFFRDEKVYESLKRHTFPALLKEKPPNSAIRIWVIGCSTGEEAYSLAILLEEYMDATNQRSPVQIFATDIDNEALLVARKAVYGENISAQVSPERLSRFFYKENNSYHVSKNIRDMVIFANHNFLKDPPYIRLDIISCRNLLIYLDPKLQDKILPLFHYTLKKSGFLILGNSESVREFTHLFLPVDAACKIFQRTDTPSRLASVFKPESFTTRGTESQRNQETWTSAELDIREATLKTVLENYTPACVVIDETYKIVYFHAQTKNYLQQPVGEPTLNILKLVTKDLRTELRTAISRAIKKKTTITHKGILLKNSDNPDEQRIANIIVRPFTEPKHLQGLLLIVFEDAGISPRLSGTKKGQRAASGHIAALEQELHQTKEHLQETIEELEISNDKLKTSHARVKIANDELQSANEELETSREELHSINEELTTVNSELQEKIKELSQANNDINNMLNITEIGAIFLDKKLRIKFFTPTTKKVIDILETDLERPIYQLATHTIYHNIMEDIRKVIIHSEPIEKEIKTEDNTWYLIRILPYRTVTNLVTGAVITIIDITEHKRNTEELQLLQTITMAIDESKDIDSALTVTLQKVCEVTRWVLGEAWLPDEAGTLLKQSATWCSNADYLKPFTDESKNFLFSKGEGLPGHAWLTKQPLWIRDVTLNANFLRAQIALEAGLKAGLAIPVLAANEVVAIIVFFMYEAKDKDEPLIKLISAVASQLGLVIQRKQMQETLQQAYDRLEKRVGERTGELLKTNALLKEEITNHRLAEEKLHTLSHAVEQNPCTVVIADAKGNIEYVNEKFVQLTGYTASEAIGKNPRILKSGEMPPEKYTCLWDTITSGGVWRGEFHNKKKNGELYWESATISPIKNKEGVITHFVAIKEDITERKCLEEEMKGLAHFPAENPYPVLRIAYNGIILYANASSSDLLREWDCAVNQPAPDFLKQLAANALENKASKKNIKITCGNRTFFFAIVPVVDAQYVNLYGIDISSLI